MVDYICQYLSTVRERQVTPNVKPGYLRAQIPASAPEEPDSWDSIFGDIEQIIMPGVVHWQSPHMHAYYPALTSWPSLLGDMLADAINCLGFTWASSPACTELEMNIMDWLAKMLGLPDFFLHHHPSSQGGGVLQVPVMTTFHLTQGRDEHRKQGRILPHILPSSTECLYTTPPPLSLPPHLFQLPVHICPCLHHIPLLEIDGLSI